MCLVWCVVIVVVVLLLVASVLASMRWLLCGEKMRVTKKTISEIVDKLHRREFISITVSIENKKSPVGNHFHGNGTAVFFTLQKRQDEIRAFFGHYPAFRCAHVRYDLLAHGVVALGEDDDFACSV